MGLSGLSSERGGVRHPFPVAQIGEERFGMQTHRGHRVVAELQPERRRLRIERSVDLFSWCPSIAFLGSIHASSERTGRADDLLVRFVDGHMAQGRSREVGAKLPGLD